MKFRRDHFSTPLAAGLLSGAVVAAADILASVLYSYHEFGPTLVVAFLKTSLFCAGPTICFRKFKLFKNTVWRWYTFGSCTLFGLAMCMALSPQIKHIRHTDIPWVLTFATLVYCLFGGSVGWLIADTYDASKRARR